MVIIVSDKYTFDISLVIRPVSALRCMKVKVNPKTYHKYASMFFNRHKKYYSPVTNNHRVNHVYLLFKDDFDRIGRGQYLFK